MGTFRNPISNLTTRGQGLGETRPLRGTRPLGETRPLGGTRPLGETLPLGGTRPLGGTLPLGGTRPLGEARPLGGTRPLGETLGGTRPLGETRPLGGRRGQKVPSEHALGYFCSCQYGLRTHTEESQFSFRLTLGQEQHLQESGGKVRPRNLRAGWGFMA